MSTSRWLWEWATISTNTNENFRMLSIRVGIMPITNLPTTFTIPGTTRTSERRKAISPKRVDMLKALTEFMITRADWESWNTQPERAVLWPASSLTNLELLTKTPPEHFTTAETMTTASGCTMSRLTTTHGVSFVRTPFRPNMTSSAMKL